jgi:hypothetical protein
LIRNQGSAIRSALAALDHLLLGTSDLARGTAWFEQKTGVKAVVGGPHPGRGTRNALVALQGRHYLEIIAPDPAQPAENLRMPLRALREPRLIAWAAATDDIDGLTARIRASGHRSAGPRDGSRARPDGSVLTWTTLAIDTDLAGAEVDPIPFFIEWADPTIHPSGDSPKGCELMTLEFGHPEAKRLRATLAALGIDAAVRQEREVTLVATLNTPNGSVVLS